MTEWTYPQQPATRSLSGTELRDLLLGGGWTLDNHAGDWCRLRRSLGEGESALIVIPLNPADGDYAAQLRLAKEDVERLGDAAITLPGSA